MEIGRFLRLALRITKALEDIHQHGIVHKNIEPGNILISTVSDEVKITGLGSATPPERMLIQGTLPYMSPEQTGRMNRIIDHRTDLYSLGVTFYEMLTGKLPFEATDPLEWIYCHIARTAVPPIQSNPEIPQTLSDIVLRLLAKMTEDRYQSARGLISDLSHCLKQWDSNGQIDYFELGNHDVSQHFQIPQKLYGRDKEVLVLYDTFERVVSKGQSELLLISGSSGAGKSRLVNELNKPIVRERGFFVTSKPDQYNRDIPYSTIIPAVRNLVQEILTQNESQVEEWRRELQAALGSNGQVIVDIIPQAELIIGKQPEAPLLAPTEAKNRFRILFQKFLGVFTKKEHPVALFLDDLQWADSASLELLHYVFTHPESRYLFIIGAYRDNEVSPSHSLILTLDEIRKSNSRIEEIILSPFKSEHLLQFVADTLHCLPERAERLAQLIQDKTAGNPFFVMQFLNMLYKEGLIEFSPKALEWRWDAEQIQTQQYTDNVVVLMVAKLKKLPQATQQAVTLAACIGNTAEVSTLALVLKCTEETLREDLKIPVLEGLMQQTETAYRFLHDRIQQAAYSLIPDGHRTEAHLTIGRLLLENTPSDRDTESLFKISNHFILAAPLIRDVREQVEVARLLLQAGRKAKATTAYSSSIVFFSTGLSLLGPSKWREQHELSFALHFEEAECSYICGKLQEAKQLFLDLLAQSLTTSEQAAIYRVLVDLYVATAEPLKAVESGVFGLKLLGVELPMPPTNEHLQAEYEEVWSNLGTRQIEDLIDLPSLEDKNMRAALDILGVLYPSAQNHYPLLVALCFCRMVNISLNHGNSKASALGYAYFGMFIGPAFGQYKEGFRFGKLGYDLIEKNNFAAYRGKINLLFGDLINYMVRPLRTNIEYLRTGFEAALQTGDINFACFCCNHLIADLFVLGTPLDEVYQESQRRLAFTTQAGYDGPSQVIIGIQRVIRTMQGKTNCLSTFSDDDFDQDRYDERMDTYAWPIITCWYYIMKLQARVISCDYEEAVLAATKARALIDVSPNHIQGKEYWYYAALAIAAHANTADENSRAQYRKELDLHANKLKQWAESCPENFFSKYSLVAGEIARLDGRDDEAMHHYENAIKSARENGFTQNEALAFEFAARYYRNRGFETFANTYLSQAHSCYLRWGAFGKTRQLEQLFPQLSENRVGKHEATLATSSEQLDMLSVIKASQRISEEIDQENLVRTLMQIVIEQSGAQKGLLFLSRNGELRTEVEAQLSFNGIETRILSPLETSAIQSPTSIIQYVWRTRENVILADATETVNRGKFSSDTYFTQNQTKSVLCIPIVRQTEAKGLLYLENNLIAHAFTLDRLKVLEVLVAQAVIAIENARLLSEAQRAIQVREDFISIASHELKTPLTSLVAQMQLMNHLSERGALANLPKEKLSTLLLNSQQQLQRFSSLINELLDTSQIRVGKLVLEINETDFSEVIRRIVARFRPELNKDGYCLQLHLESNVTGKWDALRIEQVVINLLTNATKYGSGKPIEICLSGKGNIATLTVRDHGIGIAKEDHTRIFERFERATSIKQYGGLGLGLFITREIVKAHGGSIRVESEPGQGSYFIVELPK